MSATTTATPKNYKREIVLALCQDLGEMINGSGDVVQVYQCPFGDRCRSIKLPVYRRCWMVPKKGFSNPYTHLVNCNGQGEAGLRKLYEDTIVQKKTATTTTTTSTVGHQVAPRNKDGKDLRAYFETDGVSVSNKLVMAMHGWLHWIVATDRPLSSVENEEDRSFSRFSDTPITAKSLVQHLNRVAELVEKSIKSELAEVKAAGGKAAIMYDGWTSGQNDHFVGLFLSYCVPSAGTPKIVLLACNTVDYHKETGPDGTTIMETSIQYNAEQYIELFKHSLGFYDLDLSDGFITNQIIRNDRVHKRIGRLCNIPTVECTILKFNLEVDEFAKHNCENLVQSVRETMVAVITRPKLRTRLRHKTSLEPLVYHKTRWDGKYFMLQRFLALYDFIEQINTELGAENSKEKLIPINSDNDFKERVKLYVDFFKHFHNTRKAMQKDFLKLCDGRNELDGWVVKVQTAKADEADSSNGDDDVEEKGGIGEDRPGSLFAEVKLKYIEHDTAIAGNAAFERGVVKIQEGRANALTVPEEVACRRLRANDSGGNFGSNVDARMLSPSSIARARSAKRQRVQSHGQDAFVNCNYILGSLAPVDNLMSTAGNVMACYWYSLDQIHLEARLFLKLNHNFWDLQTVDQAFHEIRTEERQATVASANAQELESKSETDN